MEDLWGTVEGVWGGGPFGVAVVQSLARLVMSFWRKKILRICNVHLVNKYVLIFFGFFVTHQ